MADEFNRGAIFFDLRDARGDALTDELRLEFRNQVLASLNFQQAVPFPGEALLLTGVPAFPRGLWSVTLVPGKHRFKKVFVDVPAGGRAAVRETLFVDPAEVVPVFPTPGQFAQAPRWAPLIARINAGLFNSLADERRAGLLNLYAKMRHPSAENVFEFVTEIFDVRPTRFFARVDPRLRALVRELPHRFHERPGTLHDFPAGWRRIEEHGSFKTPDPTGNLQLTFATNDAGELAVDADLDDHSGLEHAFDVIRHALTGRDTHPYDIHQILVKFQNIDPGYRFT